MHRWAALALMASLSACASGNAVAPCPPPPPGGCPVYKSPLDGAGAVPCGCQPAPDEADLFPVPRGFQPWAEGFEDELRFVVGDELQVTLPFYEDEDVTTRVAPDGNIYIPLIGSVQAVNRTPAALEAELEARYTEFLRFPEVGVVPTDFGNRLVFVGGEVDDPGAFVLQGPTGVLEAIFQADGFLNTAYKKNVVLIRRGPNNLPMMRFLDLDAFANEGVPTENTLLRPFDIVFVPKSPIAKINLFVAQYIEGVVPFNQNFSYLLFDASSN